MFMCKVVFSLVHCFEMISFFPLLFVLRVFYLLGPLEMNNPELLHKSTNLDRENLTNKLILKTEKLQNVKQNSFLESKSCPTVSESHTSFAKSFIRTPILSYKSLYIVVQDLVYCHTSFVRKSHRKSNPGINYCTSFVNCHAKAYLDSYDPGETHMRILKNFQKLAKIVKNLVFIANFQILSENSV